MNSDADFSRFRLFLDDSGECAHIHERTDDGNDRCVTQLDAKMCEVWAVRLWEIKKKMEVSDE